MKKAIVIIILILTFSQTRVAAQSTIIDYAGIIKNTTGIPISNATLRLLITVRNYLDPTSIVYKETQTVTTNSMGRFNVLIGRGAVADAARYSSNWASDTRLIKVDVAFAGVPKEQHGGVVLQCVKCRKNSNMVFGNKNENDVRN
jgi:hypothetical protein